MLNHSRSRKKTTLIAGAVVIVFAMVLFIAAASMNDFAQPGQAFWGAKSGLLLTIAFALLAGLSATLLIMIPGTSSQSSETAAFDEAKPAPIPEEMKTQETAAPVAAASAAEAAPEMPSGIISETAGELRTSVEVMQEELEEILDEDVPADKEHMESLYQETDRLRKIIDGMEQLAEAQALARSLKKEPLPVAPLLREVAEKIRLAHPDREIAYSVECDPGLTVTGDAECIGRIIANIADNAAKSVKGTGTVVLAASPRADRVVFSVRDTGAGIRRSHLPHIYERFFRGAGSGVGMGLAIVKELVDACGGAIEVETAAGKGTTFTVNLPLTPSSP